jgi:hypothetical protein
MDPLYEIVFIKSLEHLGTIDRIQIATTCQLFHEFCWPKTDLSNPLHRIIRDGSTADITRISSRFLTECSIHLREIKPDFSTGCISFAAEIGRIAVFEILVERNWLSIGSTLEKEIWNIATKCGQVELMKYLKGKDIIGHLGLLITLVEKSSNVIKQLQ